MLDDSKTLQDIILRNKDIEDRGIIVVYGDDNEVFMSYKDIYERSLCLLGEFQMRGISKGDLLIFQLEDNIKFVVSFWASILGGIIPVPLVVGTNEKSINRLLKIFDITKKPSVLMEEKVFKKFNKCFKGIDNHELIDKIIELKDVNSYKVKGEIKKSDSEDTAFIQFSSGSTGMPKGVVLSHKNLIANTEGIIKGIKCTSDDSSMSWMPLTHDMGLIGFHITPFRQQVNQYLLVTSMFILNPILWIKKASEHKVTVLSSPNFGYKHFLRAYYARPEQEFNLEKVRVILNGAEPISIDIINQFLDAMEKYGLKRNTMFPVYGLAEASLAVAFPPINEMMKSISVDRFSLGVGEKVILSNGENSIKCVDEGYPVMHCDIKVCDKNGKELKNDVVGYIKIKGENVTKGFYENPKETKEVIDEEGWLNTKDLGFKHDGRLVVTGRAKDIIFINGVNYYSYDIEAVILEVDGMELGKVAAAGFHNPLKNSEEICIFIDSDKSIKDFIEIAQKVRRVVMSKLNISIDSVIPIKAMPRTASGKIQRFKLIENYKKHKYDEVLKEMSEYMDENKQEARKLGKLTETQRKLLDIYSKVFNNGNIDVDTNLIDLGADSLTIVKVQSEIDEIFLGKVNIGEIYSYQTIRKLADYIDKKDSYLEPSLILEKSIGDYKAKEDIVFKYTFDEEITEAIKEMLESKGHSLNEFMMSVLSYGFIEEFKCENLMSYTMLYGSEKVNRVKVENKEVDTFDDFVDIVKNNIENPDKMLDFKTFGNLKRDRSLNGLWILYSDYNCNNEYIKKLGGFDYILKVSENADNEIIIKNEFNTEYMNKETAEEIFKTIINLILYLSEEI